MVSILRSLAITFTISGTCAYFLTEFNFSFLKSFLLVTAIQFVGWHCFSYYNEIKVITKSNEIDELIISEMSKQSAPLPCAFCGESNIVEIRLDKDNEFRCQQCDKVSAVYLEIQSVAKTQPVNQLQNE